MAVLHQKLLITLSFSDEVDEIIKASKKRVKINVDVDIMEYILASGKHRDILTGIIFSQNAMLPQADQDGNYFISVEETSRENFVEFYNKFDKMSIQVDSDDFQILHEDIKREIKKLQSSVLGCALKIANERIVIVGQKQCVEAVDAKMSQKLQKFREELARKQEQKEFFPLPPEKIHLLDHSKSWDEIRKQHGVQVEVQRMGLWIAGPENKIEKAKMFLFMKVMNACSRTMKIRRGHWGLLQTKTGMDKAYGFLEHSTINAVIAPIPDQYEISITALSAEIADKAVSALQKAMQEKQVPLDEGTRELVRSEKGDSFVRELEECYSVKVQNSEDNLVIVGIDIAEAEEELIHFLNRNAVHKKYITIPMGLVRFVFEHSKDRLKDIERSLEGELVTIKQSDGAILVRGSQSGLKKGVKQIEEVYTHVSRDKIISQRPGVRKLFQKGFIKDVIGGLENELSLVIINESDDVISSIMETPPIQHILEDDYGKNRLVCSFKTVKGPRICVFQGDITKHNVDVIVNAANNQLWLGGGVAGAILEAGGRAIQNECDAYIRAHGDLTDGEVAVTGAGKIECKRIIHAVGPKWQKATNFIGQRELQSKQEAAKKCLESAIANILNAAQQFESVAIPALSSGIFGFPKDLCAQILVATTLKFCKNIPSCNLQEIHFINNDTSTVKAFEEEFEKNFKSKTGYKIEVPVLGGNDRSQKKWWTEDLRERKPIFTGKSSTHRVASKTDRENVPASRNTNSSNKLLTPEGIAIELVVGDLSKQKVCNFILSIHHCSGSCSKFLT